MKACRTDKYYIHIIRRFLSSPDIVKYPGVTLTQINDRIPQSWGRLNCVEKEKRGNRCSGRNSLYTPVTRHKKNQVLVSVRLLVNKKFVRGICLIRGITTSRDQLVDIVTITAIDVYKYILRIDSSRL